MKNKHSRSRRAAKIPEIEIRVHPWVPPQKRQKVKQSKEAFFILKKRWGNRIAVQEEFNVLYLNNRGHVLGLGRLSRGNSVACAVDIKLAFCLALKVGATSMVLAHNHPSGETNPSQPDIDLTRQFQQAGKFLDIKILDHLILTPHGEYYSFMDSGYL